MIVMQVMQRRRFALLLCRAEIIRTPFPQWYGTFQGGNVYTPFQVGPGVQVTLNKHELLLLTVLSTWQNNGYVNNARLYVCPEVFV